MTVPGRLRTLVIEVTNVCNFRCPQCAYVPPATKTFIDDEVFAALMAEAAEAGVRLVRFLGLGEPTLHPRLGTLLARTRLAGLRSHLVTNGSFAMRRAMCAQLTENFPDLLEISVDAATPAAYQLVRGRGAVYFARLMAAIRRFLAQGRPAGRRAVLSFVAHPETLTELALLRCQWSGLVDEIKVRAPHNFSGLARGLPSQRHTAAPAPGCSFVEDRIAVAASGAVSSCNLDFAGKHVLTRAADDARVNLASLWTDTRRLVLLESVRSGTLDAQCSGCSRCAGLRLRGSGDSRP